jgi:hypothetical protein
MIFHFAITPPFSPYAADYTAFDFDASTFSFSLPLPISLPRAAH